MPLASSAALQGSLGFPPSPCTPAGAFDTSTEPSASSVTLCTQPTRHCSQVIAVNPLTTRDGGKREERSCTPPKTYKSKKQHQQCTEVQTCPTWVSAQPSTLPAPTRHRAVVFELVWWHCVFIYCLLILPSPKILFLPFLEGQIRQRNVSFAAGSLVWLLFSSTDVFNKGGNGCSSQGEPFCHKLTFPGICFY